MFATLEVSLSALAYVVPLPLFALIASCVEEIIAPIPSPFVMLLSGSLASVQGYTLLGLLLLALMGALGKTIGALFVYGIIRKAGETAIPRFGRFFGITPEDIIRLNSKLGHGARDYMIMILLRAFPFIPSVIVSVGGGFLRVPLPLFIISTFLGTIIRDGIYLYAGFVGTEMLNNIITHSTSIETGVEIGALIGIVVLVITLSIRRRKQNISTPSIS